MTLMTDERARTDVSIPQRVHLIGIGGAHMSAIARILLARGYDVSGSDLRASPTVDELARAGARVWIGDHDASHVHNAELVVATAAATSANPELVAAQELGLTVLSRAQMVARLIAGKRTLAVAGTHGKTTTTSLAIAVVREAGLDPTFLVGGDVVGLETNAAHGDGPIAIVEADEYAHAFLEYAPEIAIVTNVEPDHIDYFGSFDEIRRAFRDFLTRVQPDGRAIVCADSPHLLEIVEDLRTSGKPGPTVETYTLGREREAEWRAVDIEPDEDGQSFTVERAGEAFLRARITLPGRHAVANALAVVAATHALGIDSASIERGLLAARGAHRRFDRHGEVCGIAVYDDYAHHPTEIRATLDAARERFGDRRIVLCFQPHTEARTRYLFEEFITCFERADALFVLETFAARETGMDGATARELAAAITRPPARYVASHDEAVELLLGEIRRGDLLLTMGAGDVDRVAGAVLDGLRLAQGNG